jgi:hypothetical protein
MPEMHFLEMLPNFYSTDIERITGYPCNLTSGAELGFPEKTDCLRFLELKKKD